MWNWWVHSLNRISAVTWSTTCALVIKSLQAHPFSSLADVQWDRIWPAGWHLLKYELNFISGCSKGDRESTHFEMAHLSFSINFITKRLMRFIQLARCSYQKVALVKQYASMQLFLLSKLWMMIAVTSVDQFYAITHSHGYQYSFWQLIWI